MTQSKSYFKQAFLRGLRYKCPKCGEGKIFQSYLKINSACPKCQERLGDFAADDAPAYLTIVLVGHLVIPLLFYVERGWSPATWKLSLSFISLALGLSFLVLPRMKGIVLGVLWSLKKTRGLTEDLEAVEEEKVMNKVK